VTSRPTSAGRGWVLSGHGSDRRQTGYQIIIVEVVLKPVPAGVVPALAGVIQNYHVGDVVVYRRPRDRGGHPIFLTPLITPCKF